MILQTKIPAKRPLQGKICLKLYLNLLICCAINHLEVNGARIKRYPVSCEIYRCHFTILFLANWVPVYFNSSDPNLSHKLHIKIRSLREQAIGKFIQARSR